MQIKYDVKKKRIDIDVDSISVDELKDVLSKLLNKDKFNVYVHNPGQKDSLIDVYEGNINIDNLGDVRR